MAGIMIMMASTDLVLFMLVLSTPMIVIGAIVYVIGVARMSRPDSK